MSEYYKGTVTRVNQTFLFFELEKKLRVYTTLLYINSVNKHLPANKSIVEINKHLFLNKKSLKNSIETLCSRKVIVLSINDQIDYQSVVIPKQNNKFIELICSVPLCQASKCICLKDIIGINKIIDKFEKYNQLIFQQLVMSTLDYIVKEIIGSSRNGYLHYVKLRFLEDFVQLEETHFNQTHWTYATVHQPQSDEFLFGNFFIDKETGSPCFASGKEIISCTCFNEYGSRDILHLIDKYILLKKYTIIRETYTCMINNVPDYHYLSHLLFSIQDVIILSFEILRTEVLPIQDIYNGGTYTLKFTCLVLAVSMPILNDKGNLEVWLHIEDETNKKIMHICLEDYFLKIFPVLKVNCKYEIYAKRRLFNAYHVGIYKANPNIMRQGLPTDSVFVNLFDLSEFAEYLDLDMAYKKLQNFSVNSKEFVTFKGKLTNKLFIEPSTKQTESRKPNFGIPGNYFIELQFINNSNKISVSLVDWESRPTPQCLIPNMILIVRDVVARGTGRYYSSFLTTFEVVGYEPEIGFQSPDYYFNNSNNINLGWGTSSFLLSLTSTTNDLMVWSRVVITKVERANISINTTDKKFNPMITILLKVLDERGCCSVLIPPNIGSRFLQIVLNLNDDFYCKWLEGLALAGNFQYPKTKYEKNSHILLKILFETIAKGLVIDVKCQKSVIGHRQYKLIDLKLPPKY